MLYLARRQIIICVCLFFLAALIAGLSIYRFDRGQSELAVISRALLDKVIILDPGHGGIDPGAVSREELYEKDVVLAIGFDLRDLLSRAGANVIMTRQSDQSLSDLPLEARVRAHVLQQQQLPAWLAENSPQFAQHHLGIDDAAQYKAGDYRVKVTRREGQMLCIDLAQIQAPAQGIGPSCGDREHVCTLVNGSETAHGRKERQIGAGTNSNLQDSATGVG